MLLAPRSFAAALAQAGAAPNEWQHGLSLFGELKYPADFKHFDYVNPNAPKGGVVRLDRDRHLRQFQHGRRRREGLAAPAARR